MLPFLSGTHQFDVLFYGSLWIADVAPFLMPLPSMFQARKCKKSLTPIDTSLHGSAN